MKRLTIAFAVAGVLLAAGRAQACNGGGGGNNLGLIYAGVFVGLPAAGAIDLSFSIHDAVVDRSSVGASIAEITLTAPQAAFGIWLATKTNDTSTAAWILLASAWPAALTIHGIVALANREEEPEPVPTSRAFHLAPTAVTDGTRLAPGLLAVGRF
jgi:hypothetical protein